MGGSIQVVYVEMVSGSQNFVIFKILLQIGTIYNVKGCMKCLRVISSAITESLPRKYNGLPL